MTPVWYAAKVNSQRRWLAWLLLCLLAFTAPAQAMNGLRLPMSAFSPGPKTACTAKPSTGDFPINKVDPSGLDVKIGYLSNDGTGVKLTSWVFTDDREAVNFIRDAPNGSLRTLEFQGHGDPSNQTTSFAGTGFGLSLLGETGLHVVGGDSISWKYGENRYVNLASLNLQAKGVKQIILSGCNTAGPATGAQLAQDLAFLEKEGINANSYPGQNELIPLPDRSIGEVTAHVLDGIEVTGNVGLIFYRGVNSNRLGMSVKFTTPHTITWLVERSH